MGDLEKLRAVPACERHSYINNAVFESPRCDTCLEKLIEAALAEERKLCATRLRKFIKDDECLDDLADEIERGE